MKLGNSAGKIDALKLLGVNASDTWIDAKKKYQSLIRHHHPDQGGDSARAREILTAWQTIDTQEKFYRAIDQQYSVSKSETQASQSLRLNITLTVPESYHGVERVLVFDHQGQRRRRWVKIPAKVNTGNIILIKNSCDLHGQDPIDLEIQVTVVDDQQWSLHGHDLYQKITIPWWDAILGCVVTPVGLDGNQHRKQLPVGTVPGTGISMGNSGWGQPNAPGTWYLKIDVHYPSLEPEILDLVKKIADTVKYTEH